MGGVFGLENLKFLGTNQYCFIITNKYCSEYYFQKQYDFSIIYLDYCISQLLLVNKRKASFFRYNKFIPTETPPRTKYTTYNKTSH